jgi:hypothetical protein
MKCCTGECAALSPLSLFAETEAKAVSFVVCQAIGLQTGSAAQPPTASKSGTETPTSCVSAWPSSKAQS